MDYVIPPPDIASIPVIGRSTRFPVRRVYCVARNYAAHAREMGFDPQRDPPCFFCKPADAIVPVEADSIGQIAYPLATENYHHEIELVIAIGRSGKNIAVERALDHVWGYAIGLDMTRRDLQTALRAKGMPWELGKSADQSAPIGPITPATDCPHIADAAIWLKVDEALRQESRTAQMIWSIAEVVSCLSAYFELHAGDLIFSGTPEGVAAVERGALLRGGIEGLGELSVRVV